MLQSPNEPAPQKAPETPSRPVYKRWIAALILAPAAVAVGWWGGWALAAVVAAFAILMSHEWQRLVAKTTSTASVARIAWAPVAAVALTLTNGPAIALCALVIGTLAATAMAPRTDIAGTPIARLWTGAGVLYIGLPAIAIMTIRAHPEFGRELLLTLFFVAWASDSGAYLAGTFIRGPKLLPNLSPSKTWAGLFGAILCGGVFALISAKLNQISPLHLYLFLGILVAFTVQVGDLLESSLKRRFKAKDTGGLIPGHGGVMDRLDGLGFASIWVAMALSFV